MRGNNVRIVQEDDRTARIFIDGHELKGVQYVDYKIGVNKIPIVTVEFVPETLNFGEDKGKCEIELKIDTQELAKVVVDEINNQLRKVNIKEVSLI